MPPESYHDYARITGTAQDPPTADSNLIHYWPYAEGSGTTAFDDKGSLDGSINGATWSTDAKTDGQALDFDGTDDDVRMGPNSINWASDFSIVLWYKNTAPSEQNEILTEGDGNFDGIRVSHNGSSTEFRGFLYGTSGTTLSVVGNAGNDTYVHAAITYDHSAKELKAYVDGSNTDTTSDGSFTDADTDDYLIVANNSRGTTNGYNISSSFAWDGRIDDVRIYDKKLSATEVQNIYDNTK